MHFLFWVGNSLSSNFPFLFFSFLVSLYHSKVIATFLSGEGGEEVVLKIEENHGSCGHRVEKFSV